MDTETRVHDAEDERVEEDEEFAVSSKPKQLPSQVVRGGGASADAELMALRGLGKDKKVSIEKDP